MSSAHATPHAAVPAATNAAPARSVMDRVFQPGRLTVGLILPLETHPDGPFPRMADHLAMAARAECHGFSALWLRDVPFYDPRYGDAAQILEPMVYMAALAAATTHIALGTAGIVLPLREPKLLAKQANTVDQLSAGRLLLGLSSGDRPAEYPLFDIDFASRGERFRDAFEVLRTVAETDFPRFESERFGRSGGQFQLVPRPVRATLPKIGIGRAQQCTDWLAAHLDGLIVPAPAAIDLAALASDWQARVARTAPSVPYKPLGVAGFLDLVEDAHHPFQRIPGGFRSGRIGLAGFLGAVHEAGIHHVALNPKISRRPYGELMEELSQHVLPQVAGYAAGDGTTVVSPSHGVS